MRVLRPWSFCEWLAQVTEWQKGKSWTESELWKWADSWWCFSTPAKHLSRPDPSLLPPTNMALWQDSPRVQHCKKVYCRKPACVFWWGFKERSIFHTHRGRRSLSSGGVVEFHKQLHDHCECLPIQWSEVQKDLPDWEPAIKTCLGLGSIQALVTFMFFWADIRSRLKECPLDEALGIKVDKDRHTHTWDHHYQSCCPLTMAPKSIPG